MADSRISSLTAATSIATSDLLTLVQSGNNKKITFSNFSNSLATLTLTLTNKTISGSTNTLSNIANASLVNSSVTVTPGSGMSGGGTVSLGGTITLTNAGVTSLTGTANQVTFSASTGGVTATLPQNIHTGATPTFGGLTLNGVASLLAGINLGTSQAIDSTTSRLEKIGGTTVATWATSSLTESSSGFGAIPFLEMVGTLADPGNTRTTFGSRFVFTGNGTGSKKNIGMQVVLREGYLGTGDATALEINNSTSNPNGTAIGIGVQLDNGSSNLGADILAGWFSAKDAIAGGRSTAIWAETTNANDPGTKNIAVVGTANNAEINIPAYFAIGGTSPRVFSFPAATESAVIIADNMESGADIFRGYVDSSLAFKINGEGSLEIDETQGIMSQGTNLIKFTTDAFPQLRVHLNPDVENVDVAWSSSSVFSHYWSDALAYYGIGNHSFGGHAQASGYFGIIPPAFTWGPDLGSGTTPSIFNVQPLGAITLENDVYSLFAIARFQPSTLAFTGGATVGTAATVYISSAPTEGSTNASLYIAGGQFRNADGTDSSSTITGANILSGGLAVAKRLYVGTTIVTPSIGATLAQVHTLPALASSELAVISGAQVFTGKSISGSTNTLSNIANASLTNSSITIQGSAVALGGSALAVDSTPTFTSVTLSSLTQGRVPIVGASGLLTDNSSLTFGADAINAPKHNATTWVSTPSLISPSSALTITPAAGNNLNISLSGTGDLAVNTNQLYVDTSAGFVGVGTAAPISNLHVHTAGVTGSSMYFTNTDTGVTSADGLSVGIDSSENAFLWHYENKDLYFGLNNTEKMRLTAAGDLVLGATGKLRLDGSGSGDTYIYESAANTITMQIGGTDRFRFTNATQIELNGIYFANSSNAFLFGNSTGNRTRINPATGTVDITSAGVFAWNDGTSNPGTIDTGISRVSAGVVGIGTGAAGSVAGTLQAGILTALAAGTASTPMLSVTGATFAGGSATTTKPSLLVEPAGTTSTGWNTNGTLYGANAASGFTGSLIDLQVAGTSKFRINQNGIWTGAGSAEFNIAGGPGMYYYTGSVFSFRTFTDGTYLTAASLTGAAATPTLTLTQTWNTSGNPTMFLLNLTNTASGATSLLEDFKVGGSSVWSVSKAGDATAASTIRSNTGFNVNGTAGASGSFTTNDGKTVTVVGGIITSIV